MKFKTPFFFIIAGVLYLIFFISLVHAAEKVHQVVYFTSLSYQTSASFTADPISIKWGDKAIIPPGGQVTITGGGIGYSGFFPASNANPPYYDGYMPFLSFTNTPGGTTLYANTSAPSLNEFSCFVASVSDQYYRVNPTDFPCVFPPPANDNPQQFKEVEASFTLVAASNAGEGCWNFYTQSTYGSETHTGSRSVEVCIAIPQPQIDAYVGDTPGQRKITITYNQSTGQTTFSPADFAVVKNVGEAGSSLNWTSRIQYNNSTVGEFLTRNPSSGNNLSAGETETVTVPTQGLSNKPVGTYDNAATITFMGTNSQNNASAGTVSLTADLVVQAPSLSVLQSCELLANGSTSNLTITTGQSVNWTVSSDPSGYPYYWHVNNGVDVRGEGSGNTNWSGSYSYDTAGVYDVYFHAEKDGNHLACPGGKSNTIRLTVGSAFTPTPTPPPGLSCSAPSDTTAPYQTRATVGNGTVGYNYNWSGYGSCNITNRETNDGSGGSGHWIDLDCGSSQGSHSLTVTEAATGRSGQCTFSACPAGGCEEEEEEDSSPGPGALTAATDGAFGDYGVIVGSWQDPLSGTAPLNNIDLKYSFDRSAQFVGNFIDFYCVDSGSISRTVDISRQNNTQVMTEDLCDYSSSGTYTAKGIVRNNSNVVQTDTATINVARGNGTPSSGGSGGGPQITQPNY